MSTIQIEGYTVVSLRLLTNNGYCLKLKPVYVCEIWDLVANKHFAQHTPNTKHILYTV